MTWTETDDQDDPCVLCVHWDFPPGTPNEDRWDGDLEVPYGPDGERVERLFRGMHPGCRESMERHVAEQEANR